MKTRKCLSFLLFQMMLGPIIFAQEVTISDKIKLQSEVAIDNEVQSKSGIDGNLKNSALYDKVSREFMREVHSTHANDDELFLTSFESKGMGIESGQSQRDKKDEYDGDNANHRTTTHLVVAAGFNNALEKGQGLDDSDFKLGGSRFFEMGVVWRTRVFENSNWLRLRYGVSFQFNGLKPTDNRIFVEEAETTVLQEYPLDLNKSKFRMDNLVVPLHFEFGPSSRVDTDSQPWFSTANKFKIGLGGFAGINIGERQKLKYEENGDKVKRKINGDHNTNDFIYGLSGYLGWGSSSLYVKYDLNPIFDNPNPELHNISVGLRFEI